MIRLARRQTIPKERKPTLRKVVCPACRRRATPDMVSTGNRTAAETDAYLAYLWVLFNRIFTWLTTMDIDRSTPVGQERNMRVCARRPGDLM